MQGIVLLYGAMGVLGVGALLTALCVRWRRVCGWLAFLCVLVASAFLVRFAAQVFVQGPIKSPPLLELVGLRAKPFFQVDALGAFFLLIVAGLGTLAALYSIEYIAHPLYQRESLLRYYPFLLLFLAGMVGVVSAWDWLLFLAFWELMTLTSYVLVVFERERRENLRAGLKYFIITHVATGCLLLAVILLWPRGGLGFEDTRGVMIQLSLEGSRLLPFVLLLFFVGFGTKAAIFPFGDWLPDAHPAAPSAISALLSGVMIKMGIYGLLRVFVGMMPSIPMLTSWGNLFALFGGVSLFLCTLGALLQRDTKRLLAYSSMSQIGYIFLGIGVGMTFLRISPALSALGFLGALYHVLNHACFKGLLFLNAGSVLYRAGTRDLNRLGGLRFMGWTALTSLIAALAIAGVPPLNGFGSKWLLYQASLLGGLQMPVYLFWGALAWFVSALTLAYFMKFFAGVFLAPPSPSVASLEEKREVPAVMRWSQGILALACVALGLGMMPILAFLQSILEALRPGYFPDWMVLWGGSLWTAQPQPGTGVAGAWNPVGLAVALVGMTLVPCLILWAVGAPRRAVQPWLCGEEHDLAEVRTSAEGFYRPFQEVMSFAFGSRRMAITYPTLPPPRATWLRGLPRWLNVDTVYEGVVRVGARWCEWFSESHVGVPQMYVLWMAAGTGLAILVLFLLS